MRRLVVVVVAVVAVRGLLAYRERMLAAGEAELGIADG